MYGCGSKLNHQGAAGCSPSFHLPGFHFGCIFLTHSHTTKVVHAEGGGVSMCMYTYIYICTHTRTPFEGADRCHLAKDGGAVHRGG